MTRLVGVRERRYRPLFGEAYSMSYNVYVGGVWIGDYTGNVSGVWGSALLAVRGGLWELAETNERHGLLALHGCRAGDVVELLSAAATHIQDNIEQYRPLEPGNGWGDAEGAARFLQKVSEACRDDPDETLELSY